MKCRHCGHEMAFSSKRDRASGRQTDLYSCSFCGTEMREYRLNRQITRS